MFKLFIQTMTFWNRKDYIKDLPYFKKEDCPFCNSEKEDEKIILFKTDFWEIRYNKFPYYWEKQNLLAFPIEHKATTLELSNEELLDYKNVEKYMKDYFWEKNYFSFIRQWNWWRSIEHLHYHYLEWVISHCSDNNKLFKILNVT